MKILYSETRTVIRGAYLFQVRAVTTAYWSSTTKHLVLEAEVTCSDDTIDDKLGEWLAPRAPFACKPASRFAAMRLAVQDADAWFAHVKGAVKTFPASWIPVQSEEVPT